MSDSSSNFDESDFITTKEVMLDTEENNKVFKGDDAVIHKILAAFETNFDNFETDLKNDDSCDDSCDDLLGSLDDLNKQIDGLI